MNGESANAQDARLEALWADLDTNRKGWLDVAGLKKGLHQLDHPLKNADSILEATLKAVDLNQDGKIQYNEFTSFVKSTEEQLYGLFRECDANKDGKLTKTEIKDAFSKAGLAVPDSKLDAFFAEIDSNNDGVISFEEWRDFLLFIPSASPGLHSVMSYFTSTTRMNAEGDVQISEDIIDGLGKKELFLDVFFGALIRIVQPQASSRPRSALLAMEAEVSPHDAMVHLLPPEVDLDTLPTEDEILVADADKGLISVLIYYVSFSGYFVAGGISGIVSRTSTAPLDRLKVYLIAQTGVAEETVHAVKSGSPGSALANAWRSLSNATKELWRAGGMRSLYAGNGLNVVKVMPESAIKFGSYEASKRFFATWQEIDDPNYIPSYAKFCAGGVAGMVSQFAVYPVDTLKFRMQCETVEGGLRGNRLIFATFKKMLANGATSFYRGLPMGLVGIFPYAAIDLGTFEYLKRRISMKRAKRLGCHEEQAQPSGMETAAIGGFSGALGASAVYPLNLLRTRLQSQGTVLHPRTYTGIMDVTRQTLQGEGVRGLFKGLTPNLIKVVPAVSITYVCYEQSKTFMGLP